MKSFNNTSELKEFVKDKNLSDKNSNIFFNAKIELSTAENFAEIESEVMIRFDGYNSSGKLTITNSGLNPYKFPEEFEANWQTFEYKNREYLNIIGVHPKQEIGKYLIKIIPLREQYGA